MALRIVLTAFLLVHLSHCQVLGPVTLVKGEESCNGYCTGSSQCRARGGNIFQFCSRNLACCEVIGTCGHVMSAKVTFFRSPRYPNIIGGETNCQFSSPILPDAVGIRLDFLDVEMDGLSFLRSKSEEGQCDSDMIFLRGFPNWSPPPRCGNLTGYSTVIDLTKEKHGAMRDLGIVAIMSSSSYRWNIKITQFHRSQMPEIEKPPAKLLISAEGDKQENDEEKTDSTSETTEESAEEEDERKRNEKSENVTTITRRIQRNQNLPEVWKASLRQHVENVQPQDCFSAEGKHYCSGTIINTKFILTAAHCFFGSSKTNGMINLRKVQVLLGPSANKCKGNSTNSYRQIEKVTFHSAYDPNLVLNDLALVQLTDPIQSDGHGDKDKMRLATEHEEVDFSGKVGLVNYLLSKETLKDDETATSKGEDESEEDDRKRAEDAEDDDGPRQEFEVQSDSFCAELMEGQFSAKQEIVEAHPKYRNIFNSTMCVMAKGSSSFKGSGLGDSGGPLVVLDQFGKPVLLGVLSYGVSPEIDPQVNNNVDYFTSVGHYRTWIELSMLK